MPALRWQWLGRTSYRQSVARQEDARARLLQGDIGAARLFLCEHDPVITLGRSAAREHVLASAEELAALGIELLAVSRGGDVTYHGPGQLMVYPVVRIGASVVAFLAAVAGALGKVCAELGVAGAMWRREPAGLWLGDAKLAACGVHLRRRVSVHGFALNVDTPPDAWRHIVPCGLAAPVTSLGAELRRRGLPVPTVKEVAQRAAPLLVHALDTVRSGAIQSAASTRTV